MQEHTGSKSSTTQTEGMLAKWGVLGKTSVAQATKHAQQPVKRAAPMIKNPQVEVRGRFGLSESNVIDSIQPMMSSEEYRALLGGTSRSPPDHQPLRPEPKSPSKMNKTLGVPKHPESDSSDDDDPLSFRKRQVADSKMKSADIPQAPISPKCLFAHIIDCSQYSPV